MRGRNRVGGIATVKELEIRYGCKPDMFGWRASGGIEGNGKWFGQCMSLIPMASLCMRSRMSSAPNLFSLKRVCAWENCTATGLHKSSVRLASNALQEPPPMSGVGTAGAAEALAVGGGGAVILPCV
jgi:hypothetical protein